MASRRAAVVGSHLQLQAAPPAASPAPSPAEAAAVAGKVAVITGASSGIGKAIAEVLAGAGMRVVLAARREDLLQSVAAGIRASGGTAAWVCADAGKDADVAAVFAFAAEKFGGTDFVVANAGWEGSTTPLLKKDTASEVTAVYDVNLMGCHHALRHGVAAMAKRGGGAIVFISSIFSGSCVGPAGIAGVMDSMVPYVASKAAVDALHTFSATASAAKGVRSYCFNPSIFASELTERVYSSFGMKSKTPGVVKGPHFFNPYFKKSTGDPRDIGRAALAIAANTTRWPAGSRIVIDNNATIDSAIFGPSAATGKASRTNPAGWPTPDQIKPHLRDVRGAPYVF